MDQEYFKNQFRVATIRLNHWDYSWPSMYFVTICTDDRQCCLAEIKDDQGYLSEVGIVIFACWSEIPSHFNNVELDDWIIMPNHLHGIIVIKEKDFGHPQGRDTVYRVSTERKFGSVPPKSLSSILNTFKGAVTRRCYKSNLDFHWQPNYYEHIIRDEDDFARIKEYIANNPGKWAEDRNNSLNIK